MDFLTITGFIAGIALLVVGAEMFVRGAAKLAVSIGISPLVVGLTVVAYGTSAPELAVTLQSVLRDPPRPGLAIGNVVGSNISNVLLVLGITSVVCPLTVSRQLVRRGVPVMIVVCASLALFGADGVVSRGEGLLLAGAAVVYTAHAIRQSRREEAGSRQPGSGRGGEGRMPGRHTLSNSLLTIAGLGVLVLGANWLVASAVALSQYFGINELIIGLTVVAVGTSLPEIATSIVAGIRGHRDIAVGNVVGSNIFNILFVLGLTALAAPGGVEVSHAAMHFDIPVMIVVAVACLPVFFNGFRIARWEGLLFLGYYGAYTAFLILQATKHDALRPFSIIVLFYAAPLTVVTLAVLSWRAIRLERRAKATTKSSRSGEDHA